MEKLRESLKNLHKELKDSKNIDEESVKVLHELIADIQNILEKNEKLPDTGRSKLLTSLKETAEKFEISHHKLTGDINIVISSLSNIGV
jgi:GTP-binding protein EngB required for normal cell division